jgi:hypothetical protein
MHNPDLLTAVIACVCAIALIYISFKAWDASLLSREQKLRDLATADTAERDLAALNGYIWCQLWRRSHVLAIAQKLGMHINHIEAAAVISIVKQDFRPQVGVNNSVIEAALRKYAAQEMPEFIPKQQPGCWPEFKPLQQDLYTNGYICTLCDYTWTESHAEPTAGTCPDCGRNDIIPSLFEKEPNPNV